jgi:hypothetical protein
MLPPSDSMLPPAACVVAVLPPLVSDQPEWMLPPVGVGAAGMDAPHADIDACTWAASARTLHTGIRARQTAGTLHAGIATGLAIVAHARSVWRIYWWSDELTATLASVRFHTLRWSSLVDDSVPVANDRSVRVMRVLQQLHRS